MGKLVFIVEDSAACAETLEIALESIAGVEPRAIDGSRAGIAKLKECVDQIAAVITDLHLAKSDGFDLIRELRADSRFARIPILLISGDSDPLLPERALALGANAFFSKPYSPAAVRKKLEQLIC
jgi:CheY-like chemotaxis protein